jgi:tetratricopeptide (TPR) repeat protein
MFNVRNLHFIVLGIILGASSGYVFAFYQVESAMPPPRLDQSSLPSGHPDIPDKDQMFALFNEALARTPNDPVLLTRYGNFLFTIEDFNGAVEAYQKVLAIQPNNLNVRTDMGTAFWNLGQRDRAMAEYEKSLATDPKHMNTLHTLFMVQLEGLRDANKAAELLKQIEAADPSYPPIPDLKRQLEAVQAVK